MQKCENCANLDHCVDAGEPCVDCLSVFEDEEMESDEFEEVDFEDEDFDDTDEFDFEDEDFDDTDEFDMEDYTGGESWEDFCEHEDFE